MPASLGSAPPTPWFGFAPTASAMACCPLVLRGINAVAPHEGMAPRPRSAGAPVAAESMGTCDSTSRETAREEKCHKESACECLCVMPWLCAVDAQVDTGMRYCRCTAAVSVVGLL